jgi:hypothetical protein
MNAASGASGKSATDRWNVVVEVDGFVGWTRHIVPWKPNAAFPAATASVHAVAPMSAMLRGAISRRMSPPGTGGLTAA